MVIQRFVVLAVSIFAYFGPLPAMMAQSADTPICRQGGTDRNERSLSDNLSAGTAWKADASLKNAENVANWYYLGVCQSSGNEEFTMKTIPLLIASFIAMTLGLTLSACAETQPGPTPGMEATYDQTLLSAIGSLADAHLMQTRHTLEILARTAEAQSAQWERMKPLVITSVPPILPQVLWFALTDGTYCTSAEGMTDLNLSDRSYFPKLMAGETVCGDLVVSKSTGKKSVIIAVPVKKNGQVVGGIGASIFADDLSQLLNEQLKLPTGTLFYALTLNGLTAFHIDPKLDFVDPRQLQSPSLSEAVGKILGQPKGEVIYEFNDSPRRVVFNTSPLTGWRVAFGRVLPKARQ
jgi:hypothetical protein